MEEPFLSRILDRDDESMPAEDDSVRLPSASSSGSSVASAIFNFTNAMIGAGCLGLGSAMAKSGGMLSILTLIVFAWLFKLSLDLLIALSLRHGTSSFEGLAQLALGNMGRLGLMASKFLYSFGCLIAYVVVIKDNLGPAVSSLLFGNQGTDDDTSSSKTFMKTVLQDDAFVTWAVGILVMLPLCLLRDMTPLAKFSVCSVFGMITIVGIVIYLYVSPTQSPSIRMPGQGTLYEHWFEIRPAYLECLGTFVFTYASQHVVHMTFLSLKPELQTLDNWKRISKYAIGLSAIVSMTVGLVVYITFWESTDSDIFSMYPNIPIVNMAKMLLCFTLVLTFPLPFFTCRELFLVLTTTNISSTVDEDDHDDGLNYVEATSTMHDNLDDPLLELESGSLDGSDSHQRGRTRHMRISSFHEPALFRKLCFDEVNDETLMGNGGAIPIPGAPLHGWRARVFQSPTQKLQLKLPYHFLWTTGMWFLVIDLAIAAPNLGDVLNVVGCATGTMIAFFFPGAIAYKLEGYSWKAAVIFGTGLVIAPVGTFYSVKKLIEDLI
jgi:sodium-coupled neutral amino acid transporter 11